MALPGIGIFFCLTLAGAFLAPALLFGLVAIIHLKQENQIESCQRSFAGRQQKYSRTKLRPL